MIAAAVDVILVLVVVEAAGLVIYNLRTRRGIPARLLLGNLAAGFCLMLAIRLSLSWPASDPKRQAAIAAALFAALLAHAFDLFSRWQA